MVGRDPPGLRHLPAAAQRLGQLADGDGGRGQQQNGEPLAPIHGDHGKHALEGREQEHRQLHGRPGQKRLVHGGVGQQTLLQQRAVLTAHIEGVEQLAQGEGGKGHGVGYRPLQARGGQPGEAQEIGRQGQPAHHQPLPGQAQGEAPVEQPPVRRAGRLLHGALLHRLHPQGQRREGVGDQIEPQKLHRSQGHLPKIQQGGGEDGEDLPDVAGEEIVDGLADVGPDPAALLDGGHDGGKVVIGENEVGRPLGHIGAGAPHSAADVRRLQGRGVVHPVPCHSHHTAPLLPGFHNAHFVLRRYPGEYRKAVDVLLQGLLRQEFQLRPGHRQVARAIDVQLPGHRQGRGLVVPGDHHRPDSRPVAQGHRLPYLGAGRVHHAEQPQEGQPALNGPGDHGGRQEGQIPAGHPQHPQSPPGHLLVGPEDPLPLPGGENPLRAGCAAFQQNVRRTLDEHPKAALRPGVDGGHELPAGVKGELPLPGPLLVQLVPVQPLPGGGHDEGPLCGVPLGGGRARPPLQPRVVAQGPSQQRISPPSSGGDPHLLHRHPVLGEGPGLVGADHTGAPQGLHGGQLLHDGPPGGHPPHPQGQHDGNDGGQALRDGGHRQ